MHPGPPPASTLTDPKSDPAGIAMTTPEHATPVEEARETSMDKTTMAKTEAMGQPIDVPEALRGFTPEELKAFEDKFRRKLDFRLLPALIALYVTNYLNRNAIGAARLGGLEEELNFGPNQFQTCVSILFVGYILMQVPSNLILNKIGRPAMYLTACGVIWGVLCACMGAVNSFGGMVACRFLIGFVQAAYYPGCVATLSAWYPRAELGVRVGLLYTGAMGAGAFAGLIGAGIMDSMDGVRGLLAWRWLFIIEGLLSIAVAIIVFFILPDFPANTTKWLTPQERELALWRLRLDAAGEDDWTSSKEQPFLGGFKLVVRDPKNWLLALVVYGAGAALVINSFFPTVVASFGRDRTTTMLLTAPPYLLACIVTNVVAWNADRTRERYWHTVSPLLTALIGFVISCAATGIGPRYFGALIMIPGIYASFNMAIVWTANTNNRPAVKRAAAVAFNNSCSTLSAIYGSYLYPNNSGPRFVLAFSVNAGMALMAITASTVLMFVLKKENRKLEAREQELERAGQPDTVGKGFRYMH